MKIQDIYKAIGDSGCYFLCILHCCEKINGFQQNPIKRYEEMTRAGLMEKNCFINDAKGIFEHILKSYVQHSWGELNYKAEGGEIIIQKWELKQGAKTYTHFVVVDEDYKIIFDPMENSPVIRFGKPQSLRIFWIGKVTKKK